MRIQLTWRRSLLVGTALAFTGASSCSKVAEGPSAGGEESAFVGLAPAIGDIRALAIDPGSPATIYAGAQSGGVYKSTDGGANWSPTGLTIGAISSLAIDALSPTIVFAATYDAGVFKSTDGGTTWNAAGMAGIPVLAMAMAARSDPGEPITLYAGSNDTVFKSADGGGSWSACFLGASKPVLALAIDPLVPTILFAGTAQTELIFDDSGIAVPGWQGDVMMSFDGGAMWESHGAYGWAGGYDIRALAIAPRANPGVPITKYAGTSNFALKSTTFSGTWTYVFEGVGSEIQVIAIDPQAPSTLYAGVWGHGVAKSTDAGATWNWTGLTDVTVFALSIDPGNPDVLYAGTTRGVDKSADGGVTWNPTGPGDSERPDTTITSAVGANGAPVSNGGVTESNGITLSFSGTDNVAVAGFECRLDGATFAPCTSPVTYNGLALGQHVFEARAVDSSGNLDATPALLTWTVDAPPETTIVSAKDKDGKSIANGGTTKSSTIKFTFTGSDNAGVAGFECSLDGGANGSCSSPVKFSNVSKGAHTFKVRAFDNNGHRDPTPATFTWTRK